MFERIYPGGACRLFLRSAALGLGFFFAAVAHAQAPVITAVSAPRQVVTLGQNLTLSVTAPTAASLQWKRNGRPLPGATAATHAITSASPARDTGWYQVVAANASGSTASAAIFVNVVVPVPQTISWGGPIYGLSSPSLTNVTALAVSHSHGLVLHGDGTVQHWSRFFPGETTPPAGLSGVVALACAHLHSLALKSDGTVVEWGSYENGTYPVVAGLVPGLTDVVAIADTSTHSLALKRDGTVVVWGRSSLTSSVSVPAGLNQVAGIAAGPYYCLAVKADGTVVAWGLSDTAGGQLPSGLANVVSVCAGSSVAAALKADGTVATWGNRFNTGPITPPAGLGGVVGLAVDDTSFYAVKSDGFTASWGTPPQYGTLPTGDFANVLLVAAGGGNIVGLANAAGAVPAGIAASPISVTTGLGKTVTFSVTPSGTPPFFYQWQRRTPDAADFYDLYSGYPSHSDVTTARLSVNGTTMEMSGDQFRCVVTNGVGAPVTSEAAALTVAEAPVFTSPSRAVFSIGNAGSFAVTATGAPVPTYRIVGGNFPMWATLDEATGVFTGTPPGSAGSPFNFIVEASNGEGSPAYRTFTLTVVEAPIFTSASPPRQTVISGRSLTLSATATDATTYQWKRNGLSIAGATNASYAITNAVPYRDSGWYRLAASNGSGTTHGPVIFVNVTANPPEFVRIGRSLGTTPAGLTSVSQIAVGYDHVLALAGDGSVVAWGSNTTGGLSLPSGLSSVVGVSAQFGMCVALKSDGTVVSWGNAILAPPGGLSTVVQVSAGMSHGLALKADRTVVAWGGNTYGQANVPSGLNDVIAVASGSNHSLALKSDGTVVAWGESADGKTTVPPGLSNVVALAAGHRHSLALKSDGTVVAWGTDFLGRSTVPAGLVAVAVGAGVYQSIALKADGTAVGWGGANGEGVIPSTTTKIVGFAPGDGVTLLMRDLTVSNAPTIPVPPVAQIKGVGQTISFSLSASGTAPLVYQWQRQPAGTTGFADLATSAVYSGVATATLTITGTTLAMSGDLFRCVVTNGIGSPATSAAVALTIAVPPSFVSAATATFFINRPVSFTTTATGTPTPSFVASGLPAWATLNSTTGVLSGTAPDATGAPFTITLTASNGIGTPATQIVVLDVRVAHSADTSPADGALNLAELTRVIELYNTRTGTVRTGRYVTAAGTVDGFAPDPAVTAGPIPVAPHSADTNRDGRLSLTELTRVLELFITRSGTIRTGAYRTQAATEDGFAAGP